VIKLTINNRIVETEEGTHLYEAAAAAGIDIPVMCRYIGTDHFTSCMVCVVKDCDTGKLIPSCSAKVRKGMVIVTDDEEVIRFRKTAIDLLLSEHVGECEAPCTLSCPAGMDIPRMNRLLAKGEFDEALKVVRQDIALPSVLGRICPAPCEGACRRKSIDEPVAICLLKRFAGDNKLTGKERCKPVVPPSNSFKIAIAGAGPAGLSAAYYLQLKGYSCDVFEATSAAGGAIRSSIPENILPVNVLDAEISIIRDTGVTFLYNQPVDKSTFLKLIDSYHAVIIACRIDEKDITAWGLESSDSGIKVDKRSYQTSLEKVFAIGSAIRPSKMAVRSMGQGKEVAFSVDQFLHNRPVTGEPSMFNSRFGRLFEEEYPEYLKESVQYGRRIPGNDITEGFTREEVMQEAARCLRCDCRGKDNCLLRIFADDYGANQKHFAGDRRKMIRKYDQHDYVIYEPGKCIKCGRCVRITELHKEELGLTFIGRGFDVEIGIPFSAELKEALTLTALEVVKACPTGALKAKFIDKK